MKQTQQLQSSGSLERHSQNTSSGAGASRLARHMTASYPPKPALWYGRNACVLHHRAARACSLGLRAIGRSAQRVHHHFATEAVSARRRSIFRAFATESSRQQTTKIWLKTHAGQWILNFPYFAGVTERAVGRSRTSRTASRHHGACQREQKCGVLQSPLDSIISGCHLRY